MPSRIIACLPFLVAALLGDASVKAQTTAAPVAPVVPGVQAAFPPATLVERARGTQITDAAGAVAGVVESSSERATVLRTATRKVQVPASALVRRGGRPSLGITAQELDSLLAVADAYQTKTHPAPAPIPLPKGYVAITSASKLPPPPRLATTGSKPMGEQQ